MKGKSSKKKSPKPRKAPKPQKPETGSRQFCAHCEKQLGVDERVLFVEEEVGRVFCSEDCIVGFFKPEIERLEKVYLAQVDSKDIPADEREGLAHLRWSTLENPVEVWKSPTPMGDNCYALISDFNYRGNQIWCICLSLFLRGEPSFLFIAMITKNSALVDQYRKGERVEIALKKETPEMGNPKNMDRLAEPWTEEETFQAKRISERGSDDIPTEDYTKYEECMEQTLQNPDEVWSHMSETEGSKLFYHFIKYFSEASKRAWYVIVAKETEEEDEIEILDAFPTRDTSLVDRYRQGEQEIGANTALPATGTGGGRIVH